jgi:hypothetical protein
MKTPGVSPKLQYTIRAIMAGRDWQAIANDLGVTLRSVRYQLDGSNGREVTYHFVGLIAAKMPYTWAQIQKEM